MQKAPSICDDGNEGESMRSCLPMASLDTYTFKDPEVARCPFDYYAKMRSLDPVHLDPGLGWYWITRWEDVVAAALDAETFSSKTDVQFRKSFRPLAQKLLDEAGTKIVDTLVTSDPPAADEYRAVAAKFFPPARMTELLPKIEATADELISQFAHAGVVEMSSQYSRRLVGTILADELSLPMSDLDKFKKWAEVTGELMAIGLSEEDEVRGVRKMMDLVRYLDSHIEQAKETGLPGTVIRTIVDSARRDGSPFSKEERSWMTFLTFTAANNTTVNMLNAVMAQLAQNSELQNRLRDDPALIQNFVEEMLRLESSAQALARTATRDVTIGGTTIPRGSTVLLCIGSANRDESRWGSEAANVQVGRSDARKHLGFGWGRHQCIGMHLAKAEIRVTVKQFLSRLKNIRLADPANPPLQLPLVFHRGLKELHLRFDKDS